MTDNTYRLAAIMFTDIVGYSRLMGEDETRTFKLLGAYRDILGPIIADNGGEVLEFIGDAVFARFDSGLSAVRAGISIQEALGEFNRRQAQTGENDELHSRIGIHLGDVMVRDGSLYGDDVNIAARLEPLAEPGCICISQAVYDQIRDKPDIPVVALGPQSLKNIRQKVSVYQVVPGGVTRQTRALFARRAALAWVRAHRGAVAGTVVVAAVAIGAWLGPLLPKPEAAGASYVSVEHFRNLSPATLDAYMSDGMLEAITARLGGIPGLYMVSSEQAIGAPYILRGAMQRQGTSLRITYKIVRRKDGAELAGHTADGDMREIFALQDRVAQSIASDLAANLGIDPSRLAVLKMTVNLGAYDLYLQARDYLRRPRSPANADNAAKLFHEALAIDPGFARAEAGLCETLWIRYDLSRDTRWADEATRACERANALDPDLAEVHIALGENLRGRGRHDEAVAEFERAIAIDPKNDQAYRALARVFEASNRPQDAERTYRRAISLQPGNWAGHYNYGNFLVSQKRFDEAIASYQTVLQLTPDNVYAYNNLGAAYFLSGRFDEAIVAYRRSMELTPTRDSLSNLGTAFYYRGSFTEAASMFQRAAEMAPEDYRLWANLADATARTGGPAADARTHYERALDFAQARLRVNPADAEAYEYAARCAAALGDAALARSAVGKAIELAPASSDVLLTAALVSNKLGQPDVAMRHLERAVSLGYPVKLLAAEPELQNLRSSPRFGRLLAADDNHQPGPEQKGPGKRP